MATVLECARFFAKCGYSPVPVALDGTKKPPERCGWRSAQRYIGSDAFLRQWFSNDAHGIALVQGRVSGGGQGQCAEILEIETESVYRQWQEQMHLMGHGPLCDRLSLACVSGGGGIHLYYRFIGEPAGNQKLAYTHGAIEGHKVGADGFTCIIETRGEGGYVVAPGSPASVHKSGNPYRVLTGTFKEVPVLTAQERQQVFTAARALNEKPERSYSAPKFSAPVVDSSGMKPGDDFNLRGVQEALACLQRHGWQIGDEEAGYVEMVRPGKSRKEGAAGTFGKVGPGVLHCFSSNAAPFEMDGNYGPFAILALLDFGGDYKACAAHLSSIGFGGERIETRREKTTPRSVPVPPPYSGKWPALKDIPPPPEFDVPESSPVPCTPVENALPEPELEFEALSEKPAPPVQKAPVATNPELESLRKLGAEAEAAMLEQAEAEFWAGWRELSLLLDALPRMTWQKSSGVFVSDVANWVHLALERCRFRKRLHGGPEWIEHRAGLDLCAGFDQLYQNLDSLKWWTPETTNEAVAPCR